MNCPQCDAELDLDEYDVDKGDVVSCWSAAPTSKW